MLDEADALYGLALEEFTGARDELAKRLRADKRRDEADAVHALRKPSLAAWAINQAVRGGAAETKEWAAAGDELRKAHEALMGGGDPAAVRAASERERAAVRALTHRALHALGERASEPTAEKIRTTLHAAAADEELREEIQRGRLGHESEGGAGGWPAVGGDIAESAPRERTERRSRQRPTGVSDAERRRRDAAARAQREAERAEEAEADAEAAAQNARDALAEARRAVKAAARARG